MSLNHRHPLPAADNYTSTKSEAEAIQKDAIRALHDQLDTEET